MLNKNFREFIELLEKHGVKYLVVGGHAVAVHGFPRFTEDLDVFIAVSEENASKMPKIFKEFGFADLKLKPADFLERDMVVEIGRAPLKIQVITGIDGVTFEECARKPFLVKQGGLTVPFINIEELLKNKAASPRAKDKIDLEELKRVRKMKL